jgi:hypothetical protein
VFRRLLQGPALNVRDDHQSAPSLEGSGGSASSTGTPTERTRLVERTADETQESVARAPEEEWVAPALELEWDVEEAPTRVHPGSLLDIPPLPPLDLGRTFESRTVEHDGADAHLRERESHTAPVDPGRRSLAADDAVERTAPLDPNATQELQPLDIDIVGDAAKHVPSAPRELKRLSAADGPAVAEPRAGRSSVPDWPPRAAARRTRSRRPLWAAGTAAFVLGAGTYTWFAARASGDIAIETTPPDAQVSLDGVRVSGEHSPFRQAHVRLGEHELLVEKLGFVPMHQTLSLRQRQREQTFVVSLAPDARDATLSVSSIPSGATILIDGQATGSSTPAALKQLSLGRHTVSLQLDGYGAAEQSVRVPEDALVSITLSKTEATLAAERRTATPRNPAEARAQAREAARQHRAELRAARQAARAARAQKGLGAAETSEPAADADVGMLQLTSRQPAEVYVDGRSVGSTPLRGLELPAGRHTLKLESAVLELSKTLDVVIAPGKNLTKNIDLSR